MKNNEIYQLAKEYVADPNCWWELWISDQGLNDREKMIFYNFVKHLKLMKLNISFPNPRQN